MTRNPAIPVLSKELDIGKPCVVITLIAYPSQLAVLDSPDRICSIFFCVPTSPPFCLCSRLLGVFLLDFEGIDLVLFDLP
jgi:hypothetical protein